MSKNQRFSGNFLGYFWTSWLPPRKSLLNMYGFHLFSVYTTVCLFSNIVSQFSNIDNFRKAAHPADNIIIVTLSTRFQSFKNLHQIVLFSLASENSLAESLFLTIHKIAALNWRERKVLSKKLVTGSSSE